MTVADIQTREDLQFISDAQDVQAINDHLGIGTGEYGSYFVVVSDGDYSEVYGMVGIVPLLDKSLTRVR